MQDSASGPDSQVFSKELEVRNPIESGRRKAKHHQWLTEDIGRPALAQHLYAVIG
ncbi:P63C domain-containing protein [Candidatus Binatus sp.]|uniref:P63C domain-containing protein n=1 Tax=Candidatus Binatus sp. TaxID=2811406 RepID=UPI003FA57946